MLGLAYGAAMALVYGLLGLIVILTAGTFGTLNASPWFNLGIATLFVVLALAMFDVIVIDFSNLSRGPDTQGRRGSLALAFTMGAVAALLAGACVAPVVIKVILFSSSLYANGTAIALALPFALGLGMALPWPLAGAGMAWLPKPGAWMVRVKQIMGLLILATAAYYAYLAWTIFDNRRVDAGAVSQSVQEKLQEGWTSSLAAGLAQAEREQEVRGPQPGGDGEHRQQRQSHAEREMRDEDRQHLARHRNPAQLDELAHVLPAGVRRGSGGALAGQGEKRAVHQAAVSRERSTSTSPITHNKARPNQVSA